jgi:hypothetical protein
MCVERLMGYIKKEHRDNGSRMQFHVPIMSLRVIAYVVTRNTK